MEGNRTVGQFGRTADLIRVWWLVPMVMALSLPAIATSAGNREKVVILVVGKPGSGKTTQSKNISRRCKIPTLSMSKILDKEAGWVGTSLKKNTKANRASGDLLNDEAANRLVTKYITRKNARNGFVLDGYPTTVKQAAYLDYQLEDLGLPKPIVVHLKVSEDVAVERMLKRKRADDTPENIRRRMVDYQREESQAAGLFSAEQITVVDGTGSPKAVWAEIQKILQAAGH